MATLQARGSGRVILLLLTVTCCLIVQEVKGHGRLIEPPSRASMWRYGFDTPPNYNDHELYCGGYSRQWSRNGGRCGICGDAYDMPEPRPHEQGGKYGMGVITRRYAPNSNITVRIELTANHRGHFEFRVCPRDTSSKTDVTQECLDHHVLQRADGKGAPYYPGDLGNRVIEMRYTLPADLECTQCVFQWRYIAGNNWGDCGNGTGAVGCGNQEEFRACADVSIGKGLPPSEVPSVPTSTTTQRTRTRPTYRPISRSTSTTTESTDVSSTSAPAEAGEETAVAVWWIVLLIMCLTLLAICTVLLLLYWYYYHASDSVKRILQARGLRERLPGKRGLQNRQTGSVLTSSTFTSYPNEAIKPTVPPPLPLNPPPVPPRRVKRHSTSIDNVGNLV